MFLKSTKFWKLYGCLRRGGSNSRNIIKSFPKKEGHFFKGHQEKRFLHGANFKKKKSGNQFV